MNPESSVFVQADVECAVCGGTVPVRFPRALNMADAASWSALFDDQLNVCVLCPHCNVTGGGVTPFVVFDERRLVMFFDGRSDPSAVSGLMKLLAPLFVPGGRLAGYEMLPSVDVGVFDGDDFDLKAALLAGRFLCRHESNITSLGARLRMYEGRRLPPDAVQQILEQSLTSMCPMAAHERDDQVRSWLGDTQFDEASWETNFSNELQSEGYDGDAIARMLASERRSREQSVAWARHLEADTNSHAEAKAVFEQALAGTATYWLQLRNFSLRRTLMPEANARILGPGFEGVSGLVMSYGVDTDDPQEQIAQALSRMHPVLAIADGREVLMRPSPMLRMHLTDDTWKAAATALVLKARGIVIVIQELTDAIFFELDTVGLTSRARDTLIVFRQPGEESLRNERMMAAVAGTDLTPRDPAPLAALQRCLEASGLFAGVIGPEVDMPSVLRSVRIFMFSRLAQDSAPA